MSAAALEALLSINAHSLTPEGHKSDVFLKFGDPMGVPYPPPRMGLVEFPLDAGGFFCFRLEKPEIFFWWMGGSGPWVKSDR